MRWTLDQTKELLRLRSEGLSSLEISKRLGISRNSVCGKLVRLSDASDAVPRPLHSAQGGHRRVRPYTRPQPSPPPGLSEEDQLRWSTWWRAKNGAAIARKMAGELVT